MQDETRGGFWGLVHEDSDKRAADSPLWMLGEVASVVPLKVRAGDQELSAKRLLVNEQLLEHEREMELGELQGSTKGSPNVEIHSGSLETTTLLRPLLEVGDQVLLLPRADGQQFAVACKLISPT